MSKVSLAQVRSIGDFAIKHNWNVGFSEFVSAWSSEPSLDLNIRCELVETKVTKKHTTHTLVFVETVDGRAYQLLREAINRPVLVKLNLSDRQDTDYVTDAFKLTNAKCKISRTLLNHGEGSDILRITFVAKLKNQ